MPSNGVGVPGHGIVGAIFPVVPPVPIMKVVEDHHIISRTYLLIHHISAYIILPYNISYDISLAHAQWMEYKNCPNQRPVSSCRDSVLSRKVAHLLDVATWHGFVAQKGEETRFTLAW